METEIEQQMKIFDKILTEEMKKNTELRNWVEELQSMLEYQMGRINELEAKLQELEARHD